MYIDADHIVKNLFEQAENFQIYHKKITHKKKEGAKKNGKKGFDEVPWNQRKRTAIPDLSATGEKACSM